MTASIKINNGWYWYANTPPNAKIFWEDKTVNEESVIFTTCIFVGFHCNNIIICLSQISGLEILVTNRKNTKKCNRLCLIVHCWKLVQVYQVGLFYLYTCTCIWVIVLWHFWPQWLSHLGVLQYDHACTFRLAFPMLWIWC